MVDMDSLAVRFTGKDRVEVSREAVRSPGPGEVLVRARKSLISSGTECICLGRLFEAGSHWDDWVRYPFAPGYSMVGEIVECGPDVGDLVPGMRVTAETSHQQYATAPAIKDVFPIPDSVSDEDAAWFNIAITVQNAVRRSLAVLGEAVVVIGLGLLGQLAVQYLRLLGPRALIVIDPARTRLAMAEAHGATLALPLTVEQARAEVFHLTDEEGADVVFDVTGSAPVFSAALGLLRRFGRLIVLGDTGAPTTQHLTRDVITRGLSIIGTHANNPPLVATEHAPWSRDRMASLFFTYLARGDMRVGDLVTHRYSPLDAPEAYATLCRDRSEAMAVIFDWDQL
jgi:2-desacetyl-2-hydroxyethyl bacteriochlorophyllide A dehydrogenase